MASDRQRHVRGVYCSLYGFENYHLSFLVRAESGQICGTWLVGYTNVRVSRVGWSIVPGCTRWTTILPSLDITSSMWCWWFFSCCTSTGLSSYPEWFTSSSSARCVFPSKVVFTSLRKWAHTYLWFTVSHCDLPLFCSWKVMTGVMKRRRTVTRPATKDGVT